MIIELFSEADCAVIVNICVKFSILVETEIVLMRNSCWNEFLAMNVDMKMKVKISEQMLSLGIYGIF